MTLLGTKGMKSFGRYGAVGFELLASIAVGYYLGHWLDGKFGTSWIALVGFLLGCYAGFRSLFRAAKQMSRDIERDEALERGEDPWAPRPPPEPPSEDGMDALLAKYTHEAKVAHEAKAAQEAKAAEDTKLAEDPKPTRESTGDKVER